MLLVSADFVPGAEVGPGLSIPHPSGVVIGRGVVIGANVTFGVGVVAGVKKADMGYGEYPVIRDGAILLSHSVVAGPVCVGSHAQVGANSLVLSDVADHEVVLGVPAQRVGTRGDRIPGVAVG
jgi:serine O-acetyltransferase